ncbi:MAG: hypothetical protein A3G20_02080 [Acidobacteria bacterium RIFCSPLOWO2_12_FULL_59_11]|nr:MAG: hypothetical protein A3G20_02080 [Acidobacteria bacterium RIFCSPLOWO2_12_FULL_59_11]
MKKGACRIFFFFSFLLLANSARAALPNGFGGWGTKSFLPITAARLSSFAGEDAPVVREYGFVAGQRREYVKGSFLLTVTLWQMQDSTGSYGLFTFYREPGMATVEGEQEQAVAGGDRWLIQQGPYVVDIRGTGLTIGEAKFLATQIPRPRRSEDMLPTLPDYLPQQALVPQSPKFLLGPVAFERLEKDLPSSVIGFDLGAEAVIAQYRLDGRTVQLLLVSYATPQLAAKKLEGFQQLPIISTGEKGKQVFIQRKGPLVGFILNAPGQATAEKLLNRIQYEGVIVWNQYVSGPRENVGSMMINIFILAGVLLFISLVAGISFGGLRILAKKFLPFPIFDRPSHTEIIQLHLSE